MPSLMEAVAICRARGELPPGGPISVTSLFQQYQPSPPDSVRALLLKMLQLQPTTRFAIVIVTLTGAPRKTTLPTAWFHKLFNDGDGVGPYFRHMSGHRQILSWRVFGPFDMYTAEKKAELMAAGGAAAEGAYLRTTAAGKGIPVEQFDRFIWVMDLPASGGTADGGNIFVAATDITQQVACHEIAHDFGVAFEGDVYVNGVIQTYGDSFCPMDRGPSARSFQNHRLDYIKDNNNYQTSGPVLCAAHLQVVGWLDYVNNVVEHPRRVSTSDIMIGANMGAPPPGHSAKVALTIGALPGDPQFWVEYRAPRGFDRWVDRPVSTDTIDLPQGAVVLHERRSDLHVILVGWTAAMPGNSMNIPRTQLAIEVVQVDSVAAKVTLRIRGAD
jgi:hypothetical protein